jgi:quinol monooxygenase YgiN
MSYVIIARWRAREGLADTVEVILRELVPASRDEPGVLQFVSHRSVDNPNEFLLYEEYESEQAFLDHQQTPHFKALVLARAVPILEHRERLPFTILI